MISTKILKHYIIHHDKIKLPSLLDDDFLCFSICFSCLNEVINPKMKFNFFAVFVSFFRPLTPKKSVINMYILTYIYYFIILRNLFEM